MSEAADEHVNAAKALLRMASDVPIERTDSLNALYAQATVHAILAVARAVASCAALLDEIEDSLATLRRVD